MTTMLVMLIAGHSKTPMSHFFMLVTPIFAVTFIGSVTGCICL